MPAKPRVLVACEESGAVRDRLRAYGIDAVSCDLDYDSATPGPHHRGDVRDLLDQPWAGVIAFPPCTHLASSGARHFAAKRADGRQQAALDLVRAIWDAPIPVKALENPVGILSTHLRKPDQIIQPWQFGHPETKATCLWLDGLPALRATKDVHAEMMALPRAQRNRVHFMSPGPERAKLRSRTYAGIADAMADQWAEVFTNGL